jgi:hypothetical protein
MTSLVSCCARIVNQNKWPTLLHDRADVTVGYKLFHVHFPFKDSGPFEHLHIKFNKEILVVYCIATNAAFLVVRDSSAVRRFFFCFFARGVGRQRALHKEISGFASPILGRHISTFCGFRILFSIRNPYINRFINH